MNATRADEFSGVDMTEKEQLLTEILEQARISHKWLLADTKVRFDNQGNPDNYSDELKHAVEVQKLLESL